VSRKRARSSSTETSALSLLRLNRLHPNTLTIHSSVCPPPPPVVAALAAVRVSRSNQPSARLTSKLNDELPLHGVSAATCPAATTTTVLSLSAPQQPHRSSPQSTYSYEQRASNSPHGSTSSSSGYPFSGDYIHRKFYLPREIMAARHHLRKLKVSREPGKVIRGVVEG
jgi:hypothetical protein